MNWNLFKWPLSCIAGILMIVLFFIFIPTAVILFPQFNINLGPIHFWIKGPYNIELNYLSDLGNYIYNPKGADFFNFGLIFVAIAMIPFFIGISRFWGQNPHEKILNVCQILGFGAAFALLMIGTFSENAPWTLHELWSMIFFSLILILMGLASYALLDDDNFMKLTSYYGFGAIAFNAFFLGTGSPFLEWITVLTALAFVALLVYDGFRLE
ncbi:MAG: hypothetical protein ACTSRG_01615 [Candidatus Helarchaeota archaeon]